MANCRLATSWKLAAAALEALEAAAVREVKAVQAATPQPQLQAPQMPLSPLDARASTKPAMTPTTVINVALILIVISCRSYTVFAVNATTTTTTTTVTNTASYNYSLPSLSQTMTANSSNNSANAQSVYLPNGLLRHSVRTTAILSIAYAIVYVVGIVGNTFVVAIVCKSPRMRTVTNYFIANLAVADMLVLFCLPGTLMNNIFIPFYLGKYACKSMSYLQGVAVSASINTMLAVTLDRFLAICFPMDWHLSSRAARWTLAAIWLFSLTIALPWFIFFQLRPYASLETKEEFEVCEELWPNPQMGTLYFICANLILCYVLPLVVITVCYLGIWYKVLRRNIPGDQMKRQQIEMLMQKSKLKVVKMMFVVVIIFILSWAPLYTIFVRIRLGPQLSSWEESLIEAVMPYAQWLGASNSCINPILYTFFNSKYKHGLGEFIRVGLSCFLRSSTRSSSSPNNTAVNNNNNNNNNYQNHLLGKHAVSLKNNLAIPATQFPNATYLTCQHCRRPTTFSFEKQVVQDKQQRVAVVVVSNNSCGNISNSSSNSNSSSESISSSSSCKHHLHQQLKSNPVFPIQQLTLIPDKSVIKRNENDLRIFKSNHCISNTINTNEKLVDCNSCIKVTKDSCLKEFVESTINNNNKTQTLIRNQLIASSLSSLNLLTAQSSSPTMLPKLKENDNVNVDATNSTSILETTTNTTTTANANTKSSLDVNSMPSSSQTLALLNFHDDEQSRSRSSEQLHKQRRVKQWPVIEDKNCCKPLRSCPYTSKNMIEVRKRKRHSSASVNFVNLVTPICCESSVVADDIIINEGKVCCCENTKKNKIETKNYALQFETPATTTTTTTALKKASKTLKHKHKHLNTNSRCEDDEKQGNFNSNIEHNDSCNYKRNRQATATNTAFVTAADARRLKYSCDVHEFAHSKRISSEPAVLTADAAAQLASYEQRATNKMQSIVNATSLLTSMSATLSPTTISTTTTTTTTTSQTQNTQQLCLNNLQQQQQQLKLNTQQRNKSNINNANNYQGDNAQLSTANNNNSAGILSTTFFARVLRRPKREIKATNNDKNNNKRKHKRKLNSSSNSHISNAAGEHSTQGSSRKQSAFNVSSDDNLLFGSFHELAKICIPPSSSASPSHSQSSLVTTTRCSCSATAGNQVANLTAIATANKRCQSASLQQLTANSSVDKRLSGKLGIVSSMLKARLCSFGQSQVDQFRLRSASQNQAPRERTATLKQVYNSKARFQTKTELSSCEQKLTNAQKQVDNSQQTIGINSSVQLDNNNNNNNNSCSSLNNESNSNSNCVSIINNSKNYFDINNSVRHNKELM